MLDIKKQISTVTLFVVTIVAFLGVICPMSGASSALSHHSDCTHAAVTLSSESQSGMSDCMSGKLGFLSNLLVAMPLPEIFMYLFTAAISLVLISIFLNTYTSDVRRRVRFRSILLFYDQVKIHLFRKYYYWFGSIERPASIA